MVKTGLGHQEVNTGILGKDDKSQVQCELLHYAAFVLRILRQRCPYSFIFYLRNCVPQIFSIETLVLEIRPRGHIDGLAGEVPINYSMAPESCFAQAPLNTQYSTHKCQETEMRYFYCKVEECEAAEPKILLKFCSPLLQRDLKMERDPVLKTEQFNRVWFQSMRHAKM